MELKPLKESKKVLYPTISESKSKKSNFMKSVLFASAINIENPPPIYVAIPVYYNIYVPLTICRLVRNTTFITTIIFLLLFIKNKIKMKKSINENEEKINRLKKCIKIDSTLFIVSFIIMIISILILFDLEG